MVYGRRTLILKDFSASNETKTSDDRVPIKAAARTTPVPASIAARAEPKIPAKKGGNIDRLKSIEIKQPAAVSAEGKSKLKFIEINL